jgi:hypothetical protein
LPATKRLFQGGQSVNAPSITLRTPLEGASVELADLLVEGSVSDAAASVEVIIALDDATYGWRFCSSLFL